MEISGDPVAMATTAPMAPVTAQRRVRTDLESSIPKPYLARAMATPGMEHPDGTSEHDARGLSVLQQHASFFDQDNNGIIYPWETYIGFRAIGFNVFTSLMSTFLTNIVFSYRTLPDVLYQNALITMLSIWALFRAFKPLIVFLLFMCVSQGYLPVNLENMFSKYGQTAPNKLTLRELWNMTEGNRTALDLFGWIFSKLEWGLLYMVAKDEEGYLSKETVRSVYDGSLFDNLARKKATKEKKMD